MAPPAATSLRFLFVPLSPDRRKDIHASPGSATYREQVVPHG